MHLLMLALTGLTEEDIGELTPTEAAEITHLIFQSMKKYMKLGQQILRGMEKNNLKVGLAQPKPTILFHHTDSPY